MKLNRKFILACPLLPAVLLLAGGGCRRQPVPSGLAVCALSIAAPAGAERRLGELRAHDPDLAKVMRTGTINTLLAENPWAGRISENGVSQQALFFVDDMSARWSVGRGAGAAWLFPYSIPRARNFHTAFISSRGGGNGWPMKGAPRSGSSSTKPLKWILPGGTCASPSRPGGMGSAPG